MSIAGVAISCAVGASAFTLALRTTTVPKDEESSDLLLAGKIALFLSFCFAFLAFGLAFLLSNASPIAVLLAELPGWQARKLVYLGYSSLTIGVLFLATWLKRRTNSSSSGV